MPKPAVSLVTVATRETVPPSWSKVGGGCAKATEIPSVSNTVAVTVEVGLAADTAVMLMRLSVGGTEAGEVKAVGAPLAVWAGLNEPHFVLAQLACQSTPMFAESLETAAITIACVKVSIGEGGA
jgi:hypothetical protein